MKWGLLIVHLFVSGVAQANPCKYLEKCNQQNLEVYDIPGIEEYPLIVREEIYELVELYPELEGMSAQDILRAFDLTFY